MAVSMIIKNNMTQNRGTRGKLGSKKHLTGRQKKGMIRNIKCV